MNEIMHSKYASQMEEIKLRTNVIFFMESREGHALYLATTVESIYLQFRKILELIFHGFSRCKQRNPGKSSSS